jgi:hypothetical protein
MAHLSGQAQAAAEPEQRQSPSSRHRRSRSLSSPTRTRTNSSGLSERRRRRSDSPELAKHGDLERVDRREPTPCELLTRLLWLFLDQYVALYAEALPAVDAQARGGFVNENFEANV